MTRHITRLALAACACLLLAACWGESFKPCEISVQGVRPAKGALSAFVGSLLGRESGGQDRQGGPGGLELVVTLKVTNPNDREVVLRGLSGVVSGPEGDLGAFRLPEGRPTPLPAKGTTLVEILAEPRAGFLKGALPLLLSPARRSEIKATGHADIDTWLGVRRVAFKDVRISGGGAAQ